LELIYRFEQRLCYLLLNKHRTRRQCESLIPRFLRAVHQLRHAGLTLQLGHTLASWSQEIVAMWRFTRKNGITEGLHNKIELINRQAYGFRNFEINDCASKYYVDNHFGFGHCPTSWRRTHNWLQVTGPKPGVANKRLVFFGRDGAIGTPDPLGPRHRNAQI
jgi:hypothetical protein